MNVIPDDVRRARQLPLRAGPHAGGGRGAAARADAAGSASSRSTGNSRLGAGRARSPAGAEADPAGVADGRAQAGVDAGRRVRRGGLRRRSTSARARPAQAHRRDESIEIAALLSRPPRPGGVRHVSPPLARAGRARHVPVRAARGGARRGCAPRASRSSTSAWASRARRRRRSSARRWRTRSRRWRPTRARSGCRSCARRSRAGSGAASASALDPDTEVIPTMGSKEAVFGARARLRRRARGGPAARVPGLRARRACSRARRSSSCRCARRTAGCRTWTRVDWDARRRCCGSTTRTTRPARRRRSSSTRGPPRWRASTGSCSPPTRRTRSSTSATRRCPRCRSRDRTNVVVFNTLSKRSSMPGYRSGFVAGDPEIIAALKKYRPNVGVAPPEFFQRAAIAAWNDEAPRRRGARALPRQARRAAARAGGAGAAQRGRRRDVLPLGRGLRRARRRVARGGRDRRARARSSARPARATCGSRSVPPLEADASAAELSRLRAAPR